MPIDSLSIGSSNGAVFSCAVDMVGAVAFIIVDCREGVLMRCEIIFLAIFARPDALRSELRRELL